MSNTTAQPAENTLALPEQQRQGAVTRKATYDTGVTNLVTIELDGREEQSYTRFDAARIIRLAVREQEVRGRNGGAPRKMLVLTAGIILDGLEVGLIDEDGNQIPHPMLSDPRYRAFLDRPHRVNAQQWMQVNDLEKAVEFARYLQSHKGFRVDRNPSNPEGSERKTRDLFQARPVQPLNSNRPEDFGAHLQGFEISVNPNYEPGFSSFYEGLTEQQERWENAVAETDEQTRKAKLDNLVRNIHFVGGVHRDDERKRYWARPVDIGIVKVDDRSFPFYPIQGDDLDLNELMGELNGTSNSATSGPAPEELSLGTGPSLEGDQAF